MPRKAVTAADIRAALAVAEAVTDAATEAVTAAPGKASSKAAGPEPVPDPTAVRNAVRVTAQAIAERHPGKTVEIRIPPYIAVQAFGGLRHTRGTPPNVIETDARTWLALVTGRRSWADAVADGSLTASGTRADISTVLPLTVE